MALRRSSERAGLKGFSPGMVFAARYEIIRSVGSGGFSTVFEAQDQTDDKRVALKVFEWPPNTRKDPKFVSAFLRESYELSKLTHPNIVTFRDFGQHGPYYYMVMEFLDGQTLDDLVEKQGALSEESVALVGVEVARALGYLHNHRIIHRDIKPSNIMITRDGDVKLLDFGLAKQITDTTLRMDDEIRATPLFAAPECFRENEPADGKSDVYSLGTTLYFAATQSNPFEGDTVMAIIANHFQKHAPPLSKVTAGIHEPLSQLIGQMMSKRKDDRPTVTELIRTLATMLGAEKR
jgi:eukaryotic-like serine/threonine-protein kinase